MFAVIKTGGKQYRVAAEDVLKIEKIPGEVGDIVQIGEVLAHGEGDNVVIGAPLVAGASVAAEVIEQGKSRTVIAFKKRRRQNSRRKIGHRHLLTTVRISEILLDGAKPSKKAAAKAAPKSEDVKTEAAEAEAKPARKEAAPKKEKAEAAPKKEKAEAAPKKEKAEAAPKAKKDEPAAEAAASTAQPLFKAPKGKADDLTAIKGIGPVAAGQLSEQGITTFAQLAKLSAADIEKIDANMPFSADQIKDWQEQARELAKK